MMSGKYDPPNKAELIAQFRRTPSTAELMIADAERGLSAKEQAGSDASRARSALLSNSLTRAGAHTQARAMSPQNPKRGRKPVVTAENVEAVCKRIAEGDTEQAALLFVGIGQSTWTDAKRNSNDLQARVRAARGEWAQLRYQRHVAARYESQMARSAGLKVLKPQPIKQASLVVWHLVHRVPLNLAAIPATEITQACERFSLSADRWHRQESAFGLMKQVYDRRRQLRGYNPIRPDAEQQQQSAPAWLSDESTTYGPQYALLEEMGLRI